MVTTRRSLDEFLSHVEAFGQPCWTTMLLPVAVAVAVIISLFLGGLSWAATTPPNIVIVMVNDMGFSDLGCYGGEIHTPNIDRLAAGGLRFSQFYNTARCCPTRAALLTGLFSHQAGIGHMTGDYGIPSYQGFLKDRCVTIAECLRPAGYATLMAGKWHVGSVPEYWPLQRGFDHFFGTPTGGGVYFKGSLKIRKEVFFVHGNDPVELPDDFYVTESFTDYAVKFVDDAVRAEKPFFLYLRTLLHTGRCRRNQTIFRNTWAGTMWDGMPYVRLGFSGSGSWDCLTPPASQAREIRRPKPGANWMKRSERT